MFKQCSFDICFIKSFWFLLQIERDKLSNDNSLLTHILIKEICPTHKINLCLSLFILIDKVFLYEFGHKNSSGSVMMACTTHYKYKEMRETKKRNVCDLCVRETTIIVCGGCTKVYWRIYRQNISLPTIACTEEGLQSDVVEIKIICLLIIIILCRLNFDVHNFWSWTET